MPVKKFATLINCIDGRVQLPAIEWIKKEYGVDYVDTITEPGPDKILAEKSDELKIHSIKKRAEISVCKHVSEIIVVSGHYDCAGNPSDRKTHFRHISAAVETVKSWEFGIAVAGLWIDETWKARKIISF